MSILTPNSCNGTLEILNFVKNGILPKKYQNKDKKGKILLWKKSVKGKIAYAKIFTNNKLIKKLEDFLK